jgi:PhzF family phenazine biosynthesis protein
MEKEKIYQVDAFTSKLFGGNPAAVCVMQQWLPDELLQKIAAENNLAETAYVVKEENDYRIRWFTPSNEVDLCGHATLASSHILFNHLGYDKKEISFQSRSGILKVVKNGDLLTLDFPADVLTPMETPEEIKNAIHVNPVEVFKGQNMVLVILSSQKEIEELNPDLDLIKKVHHHGVVFSAKGNTVDFVSRCFFPNSGINEDAVTGSAHCAFTAYWAKKMGKEKFTAQQLSSRKGDLVCELKGNRVLISGNAVTYLEGEIEIPHP